MPKREPQSAAPAKRVTIIPRIHGKITKDGKVSEPDIQWIMEKWLERHPQFKARTKDMRAFWGEWHTREGYRSR
jgi:myosin-crossreactive antigen